MNFKYLPIYQWQRKLHSWLHPTKTNIANFSNLKADEPILSVNNLSVLFNTNSGVLKRALDGVDFVVNQQDFFGIIGESGSGKTTLGRTIMRMYAPSGGSVNFANQLISGPFLKRGEKRWFHENVQMIFQDPSTSINPVKTVLSIVAEPLIINGISNKKAIKFIRDINQFKRYFQLTYTDLLMVTNTAHQVKYWEAHLSAYEQFHQALATLKINERADARVMFEQVSHHLHDLFTNQKNALVNIENLAEEQQQIFQKLRSDFDHGKFSQVDIDIHATEKAIANKQNPLSQSEQLRHLTEKKAQLSEQLADVHEHFDAYYQERIGNLKTTYFNELKTKKINYLQNASLSTNNYFHYLKFKIQAIIQHNLKVVLSYYMKFVFIKAKDLNKTITSVSGIVSDYYQKMLDQVQACETNFNQSTELSVQQAMLSEVKKMRLPHKIWFKHPNFHQCLQSLFNNDVKVMEQLKELYEHLHERHQQLMQAHQEQLRNLTQAIKVVNQEIANEKKRLKQDQEFVNQQKQELKQLKQQLRALRQDKKQQFAVAKKEQAAQHQQYQPQLAHIKSLQKQIRAKYCQSRKIMTKLFFKTTWNEVKKAKGNFVSAFSQQYLHLKAFLPHWNMQSLVHVQYKKVTKRIKLFSRVFATPKLLNWVYFLKVRYQMLLADVYAALEAVGLQHEFAHRYPHEFSGGQKQRIVIARALITNPKLIIADEAISALDVSVQSRVVEIMKELAVKKKLTFLFIAHDLSMVNYACNKMIIMHNGKIVEKGSTKAIFQHPAHIYTQSLLKAIPELSAIDKNLADINMDDLAYANEYHELNQPHYIQVDGDEEHEVLATPEQYHKWNRVN